MNGVNVIQNTLKATQFVLNAYLEDLDDAALLVRPVPKANHTAWQLGHLIGAEQHLVKEQLPDAAYPALPEGFADRHNKEKSTSDDAAGFLKMADYVGLFNQTRAATIENVGKLTDADLDRPTTGQMAPFAPTLGDVLLLVSNHTFMHAGQFTVLRRKLDKPILF